MILGINRIIEAREMEPGRFYLQQSYDDDPILFQCIRMGETQEGNPVLKAMRFAPDSQYPLSLESAPYHGPLVALPDVHVRVDAPSLIATSDSSGVRPGMFIVAGDEAFVAAPGEFRGWTLINISTGRPVVGVLDHGWIAFSRWLLVIEDNQEEIPIASFGQSESGD